MGCVASREEIDKENDTKSSKYEEKVPFKPSTEMTSRPFIMNSIKRKDLILFEKTLKQNDVQSLFKTELAIQQKTMLHFIAEKDFSEGMNMAIGHILKAHPHEASQILNARDTEGNTPLIICCYNDAWETLKVLLKHEDLIDLKIKNMSGKTAFDVASDHDSPYSRLLVSKSSADQTRAVTFQQLDSPNTSQQNQGSFSGSIKAVDSMSSFPSETPSIFKSFHALSKDKAKAKTATRLATLVEELEATGGSFVDNEFPHDVYSLTNADLDEETIEELSDSIWVKAADLLANYNKIKVLGDIALNDVSKSLLVGCDLYFALATMTEFPQRLFNVFTSSEVNNKGSYSVNFLVSGVPVEVLLDDYFPCIEGSELLFSKPVKNELWFSLLEKAFAKLYGSYAQIKHITLHEALETMTGMPSKTVQLNGIEAEKLWKDMMLFDQRNYIVCAGMKEENIDLNRILTVSRVFEVNNMRVVKLINHYGEPKWTGNLSRNREKWTAKVREEVGYCVKETNSIYLELEEFMKMFDHISVCCYHDNWTRSGLEIVTQPSKPEFLKFTVEQDMDAILTVHQKLPIFLEDQETGYNLSPVEIVLAEDTENGDIRGIAYGDNNALVGTQTAFASDNVVTKLTKGTYVVRVKTYWVDDEPHDLTVNVLAPLPVAITAAEKDDYPSFLENLYTSLGSNTERRFRLQNKCEFMSSWAGSHVWIFAINQGEKTWTLNIIIDLMTNLKIAKTYKKEDNVIQLVVPPGGRVATYMKRVCGDEVEINWRFEQSWE